MYVLRILTRPLIIKCKISETRMKVTLKKKQCLTLLIETF